MASSEQKTASVLDKPDFDLADAYVAADLHLTDWLIVAPVVLTILAGSILLALRKKTDLQAPLALGSLGILVVVDWFLLCHVLNEGTQTMTMGRWLPPFGISFTVDVFGALLNFAAACVALIVAVFSSKEIGWAGKRYGFYPFLLLLMTGVSGSFLTGDLFNLYVWFEVLLIASFGLLVLGSERLQLDGAIKYSFLNLIATTLFLIATGYVYGVFGTLNMADITAKATALAESDESKAPLVTIAALYFFAFGMKTAAFPVNFWLPASYHTPRIVVQALFAGLLTKVGIYAFARTLVMIFGAVVFSDVTSTFAELIGLIAAVTMLVAAFGALAQDDVRRIAGYMVISGIGMMMAGIAMHSDVSLMAMLSYAIHSMVTMAALYLALGLAGSLSGSFSLRKMGGLYATHPLLSALFLMLVFAVAGLPPFSGFWPKLQLVRSGLETGYAWLVLAILLTGFLNIIALGRIWAHAFWRGGPSDTPDGTLNLETIGQSDDAQLYNNTTLIPLIILVALSLGLGIFAEPIMKYSTLAAENLLDPDFYIKSVFPETGRI